MGPKYPKNVDPPPHILGGEVLLIWTKTPYISQRGGHRIKVRGYSAQGGSSTITREGGNSAIQGELCGKNHENSLPPLFQYFRGKVLMVWTVLPLDCSEVGGIFHDFCHITPSELQNYSPLIIVVPLCTIPLLTLIHCPSLIVCNRYSTIANLLLMRFLSYEYPLFP